MENENEIRKFNEGKEVIVTSVEAKPSKDGKGVYKIEFVTNIGKITYKPTVTQEQIINGMVIKTVRLPEIQEVPKIVTEIGKETQRTGQCKVLASYMYWKPLKENPDGNEYRYVQGNKMLESWRIVPFVVPTETIKDY